MFCLSGSCSTLCSCTCISTTTSPCLPPCSPLPAPPPPFSSCCCCLLHTSTCFSCLYCLYFFLSTAPCTPQDTCAPRAPRRTFGAPRVAGTEAPLQVLQRLEQEIPFLLVDATTTLQATPDSAQQAYARGILRKYAEYEKLLDTILLRDVPGSVNDAGSDRALAQAIFISLLSALDSIKNACDSIINSGNMSTPRPFGDQPPHAGWFHYLIMICILSLSCCLYNM